MDCGKILKTTPNKFTKTDAIKTTLIFAITISLLTIQVPVFALTEGATEVFIQKPNGEQTTTKILPEIEGYQVRFIYRDIEFEKISGARAIANYWNPITIGSWAALTIAENGPTLITTTFIILLGTLLFNLYLERNRRKNAKHIYNYISNPEDRQILDSIIELKKQLATHIMIASKFKELSGRDIDIWTFDIKLSQAEAAGLIQRKLININDEPYTIWKNKF